MCAEISLRHRLRPGRAIGIALVVIGATYVEFVHWGRPTGYDIALWLVVVPLLFSAAVDSVRLHPRYNQLMYTGFIAIGALQYLDGDWMFLAGLFVIRGVAGLVVEYRRWLLASSYVTG